MNLDAAPICSSRRGSYEEYHPYGSTAWWAGSSATVSQKRYRFTGMERDDETGLQCHGVRYYAVWLGRWVSADPIGLGDGVNRFGYCHGGVVGGRDSSGLGVAADVVAGLKAVPGAIIEPALLVRDLGLVGMVSANNAYAGATGDTHAIIDPQDVEFVSGTAQRLGRAGLSGDKGDIARATATFALALPTGGAIGVADNIYTVFNQGMSPDQARSFLTQAAATQVGATAVGMGVNKVVGNTATGRAPTADAAGAVQRIIQARVDKVASGSPKPGDATFASGVLPKTGVAESVQNQEATNAGHAEIQTAQTMGQVGPRVIVVDSTVCPGCVSDFTAPLKSPLPLASTRIEVLSDPSAPLRSPKSTSVRAAAGKGSATTSVSIDVPAAPPTVPYDGRPPQN